MSSIRFDASADRLVRTSGLPDYDAAYTIMCWAWLNAHPANSVYAWIAGINNASSGSNYDGLYWKGVTGSQTKLTCAVDNGTYTETVGTTVPVVQTWYHVAFVRSANNAARVLLNGVQEGSTNTTMVNRAGPARMELGALSASNIDAFNGRVAAIKVWTAALTDDEIKNEMRQYRVRRTANLHLWTPIFSHTDLADRSGNGRDWTAGGTLTTEEGPPISWGGEPWVVIQPAAGGGTLYTESFTASLTPAAALSRQVGLIKAGSLTPAGTLAKAVSKAYAGSVAPAGALAKRANKPALAGSLAPGAALARQTNKALTASVAPAAALVKLVSLVKAAAAAPAGTLAKRIDASFAAGLTPASTLANVRALVINLAASLAPAATLTKRIDTAFAAGLAPSGAFAKLVNKAVAGGLTPAATLANVRAIVMSFTASLAPGATLTKRVDKASAAGLTPAGALSRLASKAFVGGVTPTGALATVRALVISLTASLTPTAALVKRADKGLAAALAPVGGLAKLVSKALGGALTFIGGLVNQYLPGGVTTTPGEAVGVAHVIHGAAGRVFVVHGAGGHAVLIHEASSRGGTD